MSEIQSSFFSAKELPSEKRFEGFRESISVVYDTSNPESTNGEFRGEISSHLVDQILLVEVEASAQNFTRSARKIAGDGLDHFMIQTFVYGKTHRLDGDCDTSGDSNKIIVYDASEPWDSWTSNFSNITLVVPRRLIAGKLTNEFGHHGKVIETNNPLGELLFGYLHSLPKSIKNLDGQAVSSLINPSLDLVATVLNQSQGELLKGGTNKDEAQVSHGCVRAMQIKRYIDYHISDPELGVEQIQRVFGLSRAHLYRVFPAKEGIAKYIRDRRLELAYRSLESARFGAPGVRVGLVAFSHGFKSESTFRRAFKEAYGVAASEVIRSCPNNLSAQENANLDSGRIWEDWFRKL